MFYVVVITQSQAVSEADDITFEVNVEHVSGIPAEDSSRTPDLLHKYASA